MVGLQELRPHFWHLRPVRKLFLLRLLKLLCSYISMEWHPDSNTKVLLSSTTTYTCLDVYPSRLTLHRVNLIDSIAPALVGLKTLTDNTD